MSNSVVLAPQNEAAHANPSAPIPFITLSDDSLFEIAPEAVEYLRCIKGPIAVVSIAGLYRTGKSYLLNLLLGRDRADAMFNVGATVNACTKGIWIWGQPVALSPEALGDDAFKHLSRDTTIVFMDTEGLGSTQRSQTQDTRIFALALLLSSLFIYNSRGVIDSNAIEDLSLVVNLTKYIQTKAQESSQDGTPSDGSELAQFFPEFLWVVRDFTLQLEEDGRKVTARDYFESALKPQPPTSDEVVQKNRIRSLLATFFPKRDCVTMVRPLNDENLLRDLINQPYESLRPEFQDQMAKLKHKIFSSLQPKRMMSSALNGTMLVSLAENYVAAFNSGSSPVIASAWDRVIERQCEEALEESKQVFAKTTNQMLEEQTPSTTIHNASLKQPVDDTAIYTIYQVARTAAEQKLWREELRSNQEAFASCSNELSAFMIQQLQQLYDKNDALSTSHNQALIAELHSSVSDTLLRVQQRPSSSSNDDNIEILQRFWQESRPTIDSFVAQYHARSRGPRKSAVLIDFVADRLIEGLIEWGAAIKTAFRLNETHLDSQISSAKQTLRQLEGKAKAAQEVLAQQKESYERALQTINERIADERKTVRDEITSKQSEIERAHQQMERLAALHKEALDRLDAQLDEARAERKRLEEAQRESEQRREVARMQSSAQLLESERNFHREEKGLLQTQQQLMQQVVDLERQVGELETEQMKELFRLEKEGQQELSQLRIQYQDEQEEMKEHTIHEIRALKEEQDTELMALQDELSEKRALLSSLRERLEAKEAMAALKKQKHALFLGGKDDCIVQ